MNPMIPKVDELTPSQISTITRKIREWCMCHGLSMESPQGGNLFNHLPVTLLPTAIPKMLFNQAMQVQTDFNRLFDIIARNNDFLINTLNRSLQDDEYSSRLMNIYMQVLKEGIAQPINFMLTRSDYMLDWNQSSDNDNNHLSLKQIEFNTISVGYAGSASVVPMLHRYVLQELGMGDPKCIPEQHCCSNNCLEPFAEGVRTAWKLYGRDKAIVLFVVLCDENNVCDQRFFEYAIKKADSSINIVRCTLTEIADNSTLGEDKTLYYKKQEVALVYYRSAYAPYCYPSEKAWDARLLVERSRCIKCPNIATHLAGVKKIQQVLAEPGVLESLISDKSSIERMRSTFTGLYSLEGENGKKSIEMALENPEKFVLKPPREGGGNNLFGEEIRTFLNSAVDGNEHLAYILMDRIFPPVAANYIVNANRKSPSEIERVVSELGIYGVYISRESDEIICNCGCGYLLRTKNVEQNEGGVGIGIAGLDSAYLV